MAKYKITIKDKETGVTSDCEPYFECKDNDMVLLALLEGTYECDCNRALLLYPNSEESDNVKCDTNGKDRRFELVRITEESGEVLWANGFRRIDSGSVTLPPSWFDFIYTEGLGVAADNSKEKFIDDLDNLAENIGNVKKNIASGDWKYQVVRIENNG